MSLCTRDTDRSPLSLTGRGSVCLHTQIHVLVSVTADRGCLADIAAARHAHRHLSDAAGWRPEAVYRRPPGNWHPHCGRLKSYGRQEVVKQCSFHQGIFTTWGD